MRRILISLGSALLLSAALSVSAFAGSDDNLTNVQLASNKAEVNQSAAAISGDAYAQKFAAAWTGDAYANNSSFIAQKNVQIATNVNDIFVKLGGLNTVR